MKKRILISLISFLFLFVGAFSLALTVDVKPIHVFAMLLLASGGYVLANQKTDTFKK
ncbi:hypothetical protein [Rummeliibacillus sp. TYF-LIM-RU47]|uniref:hypothetical protein n=1 Tax=Rummeliibacillus sp. TYF-LIM-RU47 TaxID=2608406 RepID=UPI0016802DD2|nr:hypothetical protein [Rummeliibacillus sp. TYF-LIM-RU47]